MKLTQISKIVISIFLLMLGASVANAAATGSVKTQRVLTDLEKKQIAAEFNRYFKSTDSGSYQKLNKNPWASKKAKQKKHAEKMLRLSGSLSSCRDYALKQRNQCFARSTDGSTCKLYYKARLEHCAEYF